MSGFHTEFITGIAGTGKTYTLKQRIWDNPKYGLLVATTGIAAVNLGDSSGGVTTINSALKYFDTESLQDSYVSGDLNRNMEAIALRYEHLVVDEVSMMEAAQLDVIHRAMEQVNALDTVRKRRGEGGFGLVLTGDFCQLPPVQGMFAFYANCWERAFNGDGHLTKLIKVWRQTDPDFITALNLARAGDGEKCAEVLSSRSGDNWVQFTSHLNSHFDGTTIVALNRDVDRLNWVRLDSLIRDGAQVYTSHNIKWGKQRGEWKIIPDELTLCEGAYVMILSNDNPNFTYANGDCGYVVDGNGEGNVYEIRLRRNDAHVVIRPVKRYVMQRDTPNGMTPPPEHSMTKAEYAQYTGSAEAGAYFAYLTDLTARYRISGRPYYSFADRRWIMGSVEYIPLRLAYASTVHKTQGLTLDAVQIDPVNKFFGSPSMSYVALSRCRAPGGLKIVGSPKLLEMRTNVSSEVLPWI